ncbi:MAG: methylamine utilization protein MauD [Sphingobium yanoikuyae]|jgi:methylamine dehydrogenase accessory protein MauD|uniref:Methylamine utilization protein MauD n=1 Tax=Sphingobium yanoikuyae TaxID=13690 RepID=A0A291N2E1_SPHYA|nr:MULTISPECIES: methylamine utilization protein MauD [Sphingobium]ATI81527.1 methylamine utilization protein MauD [Sphingobium yanoikuyae]MBO9526433.1 methylamine utilization protein MauD [Sphingobium yanoikuyae]PZU65788.1 MAG: methylamine utilization protein MauD [Sphingobium sp.]QNG44875.1 methylamine utilization protein MauD [Sphingobium yanoikuyae]
MLTSLIIAQILSWVAIFALGIALLAVARQVGVLHIRVAPAGALATSGGPAVGDAIVKIDARTIDGAPVTIGGHAHGTALRLLMFVSAQCPLCKNIIPMAKSFARDERVALTFVGDDDVAAQRAMITQHGLEGYAFVNGPEAGQAYGVAKLPFAVLLDAEGVILSKGLVNSREHLESLVVAHEMGIATVQDYIGSLKAQAA